MIRLLLVSILLVFGGCTTAEFTSAPGASIYPAHTGDVRVLEEFPAAGTYERLGIVTVRGVRLSDKSDLVNDLKSEAARRGANAIVLQGDVKSRRSPGGTEELLLGAFALKVRR